MSQRNSIQIKTFALSAVNCYFVVMVTFLAVILSAHLTTAFAAQPVTGEKAVEGFPYLIILGITQDGGYPQAGCRKSYCQAVFEGKRSKKHVASVAIVDPRTKKRWLIDATPDFREQLQMLDEQFPVDDSPGLAGIFLTHAHIGHYTGLMHLGREVMGAQGIPVYAMPRMLQFLQRNGPWSLLVQLKHIRLVPLEARVQVFIGDELSVLPIPVPHRDEFSETVGYLIQGPRQKALYIPDIDKWDRWNMKIEHLITRVDVAFLDGTFYADGEVPGRNMAEIPHPFIVESLRRFSDLPADERNKIHFIHLNHTNPALHSPGEAAKRIREKGFHIAEEGKIFAL